MRITRSVDVLSALVDELIALADAEDDHAAYLAARSLMSPAGVALALSPESQVNSFVVLGSFTDGADNFGCVLRCNQPAAKSRNGQPVSIDHLGVFDLDDEVAPVVELSAAYLATDNAQALMSKERPSLIVLGGDNASDGEAVAAAAAVRGFRTDYFARPESNVGRALQAVRQRRDAVAIWVGALDRRPDIVDRLTAEANKRRVPSILLASKDLPGMLEDLSLELAVVNFRPEPATMAAALEQIQNCCANLVIADAAWESAADSPFWRPGEVLEAIEWLDDLAARWRAGDLDSGVHAALKEAPARYASDISDTAKNKYGSHYVVNHSDAEITLGPHFKFGRGSAESCARVYWQTDESAQTFVIGHFGRHLPDDTS